MPRSILVVSFVACAVVLSVRAQQRPAAGPFEPQGEKVAIPGTDDCFVYVAAWENGSWYDPAFPEDDPVTRSGTVIDNSDARADVRDIVRWLQQLMEQSPDMREKTAAACEASGTNFIQIGIVRDDPRAGPGAWYKETPLVLLDFGDIEKLTKNMESTPKGNPDRERSARQRVAAVVPVTLVAHELDHAKRAALIKETDLFFYNVGRAPNLSEEEIRSQREHYQKFVDFIEREAVNDENTVILDLKNFARSGYSRTAYTDGQGGIPYQIDGVQVRVNAARALGGVEHRPGTERRFADLSADDASILEKTPAIIDRVVGKTMRLEKGGDPKGRRYVFNRSAQKEPLRTFSPFDPSDVNVPSVNSASAGDKNQDAGGSVLSYIDNSVVVAEGVRAPRLPGTTGLAASAMALTRWTGTAPSSMNASRRMALAPRRSPSTTQTIGSATPAVKAIFIATGRSSGAAFQMTMAYDGPEPLELLDPGFVLEPVQGVSASQAERELANVKGRRVTATIDAYCLQMRKPPPAAGMVYRLAKSPVQQRHPQLAPIMIASKTLKDAGQLRPDTDPIQYFHTIRQWALWSHEQGFKKEGDFADAFIEHSRKNVAAAGRQWTAELEQNVRRLLPNRWRDITQVLTLALPASSVGR